MNGNDIHHLASGNTSQGFDNLVGSRNNPAGVCKEVHWLAPIYNHLRAAGFKEEKECVVIHGIPVQFIPAFNPLTMEALDNAVVMDYDGVKVPVFTAEHLVAIALQTGRGKDRARFQSFMESDVLDTSKLADIVNRHGLVEKWKLWTQ